MAIEYEKAEEDSYIDEIRPVMGGGFAREALRAEKQQYDNEVDKLIIHSKILKPLISKSNQDDFPFSSKQFFRTLSAKLMG